MNTSVFKSDILAGRVALVTGGGSGICREIAHAMGLHGAAVVLIGRREEVVKETAAEFAKAGIKASYFAGDVREPAAMEAAVAHAVKFGGKLDIVVNGAAGNFLCKAEDLSPNGFKSVVDIDLLGTFNVSKAALPALRKSGDAIIINISATLHFLGTQMQAHVMAAKAGIDALTKNFAVEWGPYGIRVCGVAPGIIAGTEGVKRLLPGKRAEAAKEKVPVRDLGAMDDIANACLFLCSRAARYISGETIVVDGGQWLNTEPLIDGIAYKMMRALR